MKITKLRLGNLISLIYDPEKYDAVIALDHCGSVHMNNRDYPDEIRDIIGLELTETLLTKFDFETYIYIKGREIRLLFHGKRITVIIDDNINYEIKFVHELQNLVYINTGQELIDTMELLQY